MTLSTLRMTESPRAYSRDPIRCPLWPCTSLTILFKSILSLQIRHYQPSLSGRFIRRKFQHSLMAHHRSDGFFSFRPPPRGKRGHLRPDIVIALLTTLVGTTYGGLSGFDTGQSFAVCGLRNSFLDGCACLLLLLSTSCVLSLFLRSVLALARLVSAGSNTNVRSGELNVAQWTASDDPRQK
jgi:hypothetical protein